MVVDQNIEYKDREYNELSIMFYADREDPTFGVEHLDPELLDYTLDSLDHINEYLSKVREKADIVKDWNKVVLRCGAYVGEVIRHCSTEHTFHWLDYNDALILGKDLLDRYNYSIAPAAVLYRETRWFCFPLAKVEKYLEHGAEHNVKSFAKVILRQEQRELNVDGDELIPPSRRI